MTSIVTLDSIAMPNVTLSWSDFRAFNFSHASSTSEPRVGDRGSADWESVEAKEPTLRVDSDSRASWLNRLNQLNQLTVDSWLRDDSELVELKVIWPIYKYIHIHMYVGYYIYVYVYMYVYFLACCFCVSFFVCLGVNADTKRDVTLQGWRKRCRHKNRGIVNRKNREKNNV